MGDGEEGSKHDADCCYDYVGDSEERILAAHNSAGANNDGFCAAIFGDIEICFVLGIVKE